MTQTQLPVSHSLATGARLVTTDGRALPLRATRLVAHGAGGVATVKVVMTFANPFAEVLQVRYQLPLPADGAVAGFAFTLGDRRIQGQVDRRAAARERFERALVEGRTAGLLEQERSALFTQELGNLPPGAEVVAEVDVDQPLIWVDGQWEWRFPTTVAPRYLGADGREADAAAVTATIADGPLPVRLQVELLVTDTLVAGGVPTSTSHTLRAAARDGGLGITLHEAPLDRDVVVRWPVATPQVGVGLQLARPPLSAAHAHEAYGLLTLVPPSAGTLPKQPRDLIVLLDISGSMQGQPLAAAQRVTADLIASLDAHDRLELIAFATRPMPWLGAPCFATPGNKAAALRWLMALQASGGTEMRDAILAALQPLREHAQRQVVLVTDGLIGFEAEIVAAIRSRLPASSRVHVVGVGSAPNRTLTRGASRAGRGLEVLVGLHDEAAPAARRILDRTAAPLVTDLQLGGSALLGVCPVATPDLLAGAPARLSLRLRPEGGTLTVRGVTAVGPFMHELSLAPIAPASGEAFVPRLVGREWVEDLEAALAADEAVAANNASIERIGLQFGLATRATSWVAIDSQASVDPRDARHVVDMPHELAHGLSVQGLGLRPLMAQPAMLAMPLGGMSLCEDEAALPPPAAAPRARLARSEGQADANDRLVSRPAPEKAKSAEKKSAKDVGPSQPGSPPAGRAVLKLRAGDTWTFDVFGQTQWTLPAQVVLVLADGREVMVAVVPERTTRAGAMAPGLAVRLVVRGASLPGDTPLRLRLPGGLELPVVGA